MYDILEWLDNVRSPSRTVTVVDNGDGTKTWAPAGTLIQQGTNMSAVNFNRMEKGVYDSTLAIFAFVQFWLNYQRTLDAERTLMKNEAKPEVKTVNLTNSLSPPFNNSMQTVALTTPRSNLNYTVTWEFVGYAGNVGDVVISDKQLNGFKVEYTGPAPAVSLKLFISGGMLS